MSAQHTPGPVVHLAQYHCGGSRAIRPRSSIHAYQVTCKRCRAAIAKATGSAA